MICLCVCWGCQVPNEFMLPDVIIEVDANTIPPCVPELVGEDFNHCGACGNQCDWVTTDRCVEGYCTCGFSGVCLDSQECRFGECRDSEPSGAVCEFDGNCPSGHGCIRGRCSFIRCVPEECDGIDNDCDGIIDGSEMSPLSRWCWDDVTGWDELDLLPPCRRGVQLCNSGLWSSCEGGRLPIQETGLFACDGQDNNCDGCVDGQVSAVTGACVPTVIEDYDIIFILDVSNSMAAEIYAVKTAMETFASRYSANTHYRFGLILIPDRNFDGRSELVTPLTSYELFSTALAGIPNSGLGLEPSWDVVFLLGTEDIEPGWRLAATRIIIMFTDEGGQTFRTPPVTEADMCGALLHGETLVVFDMPENHSHYDECATLYELTTNPEEMALRLEEAMSDPCE